jgi:hypothetical protein
MKLIPILQAGGLKKALTLLGIGAAGVAYKGGGGGATQQEEDPYSEHIDSGSTKDSIRLNFVTNQANRKVE